MREGLGMINVLVAILVVALVWALTAMLGLPYVASLIVTILAAVYLLAPGRGLVTGGRAQRRTR
jgi:hypothetical protein